MNTIEQYMTTGLCSGCGMCSGICPAGHIVIADNTFGEYRPAAGEPACTDCGLCLRVCPFIEDASNNEEAIGARLFGSIPGIRKNQFCGYHLASYVGYSPEHRMNSASGGCATWFLERLLEKGIVDAVLCVGPGPGHDRLFDFREATTPAMLRECSKSAYYPVEMSRFIRKMREDKRKFAVIGLPCYIKAVQRAREASPRLRERIAVTAGITCGHLPAKSMTQEVAITIGRDPRDISRVTFRVKTDHTKATQYCTEYILKDGDTARAYTELEKSFFSRLFTQRSCDFCDDIFAECADVSFMDAWLPEYADERSGMSLVITRSELSATVFAGAPSAVRPIGIERVVESQTSVGLVRYKRETIYARMKAARLSRRAVPQKRAIPQPFRRMPLLLAEIACDALARRSIRRWWPSVLNNYSLVTKMKRHANFWLNRKNNISSIYGFPFRGLEKIKRTLR
jgi:coenzyme F420 hydrogenase subunit beta